MKDTCPKCKSEDITITQATDFNEDTDIEENVEDLYNAHCNSCGWDYLIVDL